MTVRQSVKEGQGATSQPEKKRKAMTDRTPSTAISCVRPGLKEFSLQIIVLSAIDINVTKEGQSLHTFLIADNTACIEFTVWKELGELIKPGDILKLTNCYCNFFKKRLRVYLFGKSGKIQRIGEFTMLFNEDLNMSNVEWRSVEQTKKKALAGGVNSGNNMKKKPEGNVIGEFELFIPVTMIVAGYSQFAENFSKWLMTDAAKGIFVYFYACDNENGISWCPDCQKCKLKHGSVLLPQ